MTRITLMTIAAVCAVAIGCAQAPAADHAPIAQVGSKDFAAKVLEAEGPVVVDFAAEWCGPCKMMEPHLAAVGKEYAGRVATYQLDVDAAGDIAQRYEIRSIPALLVFKDGEVATASVGYKDADALRELYASVAPKAE